MTSVSFVRRETQALDQWRRVAETGALFAILDACDMPAILRKVKELGDEVAVSLYRGTAEEEFESFAPYLVVVSAAVFDWIVAELWTEPWGVLIKSAAEFSALRTHFRKFLTVKSPEGAEWYFRFYDPRVLTSYLDTCMHEEVRDFFGPVTAFAAGNASAAQPALVQLVAAAY